MEPANAIYRFLRFQWLAPLKMAAHPCAALVPAVYGRALAMGEAEKGKGPVDLYLTERVAQGWATLDHHAWRGTRSEMEGGSPKMRSQIVPEFRIPVRYDAGRKNDYSTGVLCEQFLTNIPTPIIANWNVNTVSIVPSLTF